MTADMRQRGHFHVFFGIALIVFGVLGVLDIFGIVDGRGMLHAYWPFVVLFWGGGMLLFGHPGQRVFGGIITFLAVAFLLREAYGWHISIGRIFWPVVLIVVGLRALFGGAWGPGGRHAAW